MIVYSYYPLGETRVQREAEALVAAGFEVDVICPRAPTETAHERHRGVEIHRLPMRIRKANLGDQLLGYVIFGVLTSVWVAFRQYRRRYQTVQVHNLPDFLVFSAVIPKLMGIPIILDLHDLMPEFFEGRFGRNRRLASRMIRLQERLSCRFADHVITVSEHWRQTLAERGVPLEKTSVVMNVADERIFSLPADLPGSGHREGFRLIYHGTVTHRYGLDLAVEAVALLRDDIPGVSLTIIGKGDQTDELRSLCRALGVGDLVDLRDELVPAEDLPPLILEADVGVVPYRNDVFTDGLLPTKLLEYAALHLPCVAARTTAIDRYFRDTLVEFFSPGDARSLADAILKVFRSAETRARLVEGAVDFNRRYNWTTIGAGYVDTVRELADR